MATIRFPPDQSFTMKPHVLRFAEDLEKFMGGAMNFGTYSGHSPPEGPTQALDIFNPNSPAGHKLQDEICAFIQKNAKRYGARYCIRRAQIWNIERAGEGWRNQSFTGNQTVDHMDHVHVTFYATAPVVDDEPTKEIKKMAAKRWFRYVYNGQDYEVDIERGTISVTTHMDQLKMLDELGCVEMGARSKFVHDFWSGKFGATL